MKQLCSAATAAAAAAGTWQDVLLYGNKQS
jgi:hypothetical protein